MHFVHTKASCKFEKSNIESFNYVFQNSTFPINLFLGYKIKFLVKWKSKVILYLSAVFFKIVQLSALMGHLISESKLRNVGHCQRFCLRDYQTDHLARMLCVLSSFQLPEFERTGFIRFAPLNEFKVLSRAAAF